MTAAIIEALSFISLLVDIHFPFTLFLTGFILFILFGILRIGAFMDIVKNSSKDVGIVVMGLAVLPEKYAVFAVMLGSLYLLQPYYSVILDLNIPALWDRETIVLPLVVVVILIRMKLKGQYKGLTKLLEWVVQLLLRSF